MCGIVGFASQKLERNTLMQMASTLTHRGPDAAGHFFDDQAAVGLAHRRLSILDTSDAANQPFTSGCGRYVMVYNGELYNFHEIRKQVQAFGRMRVKARQENPYVTSGPDPGELHFRTTGDTEAIVEAFAHWGVSMAERLNGMFALAIYDRQEKRIFLFRDRLGIKPLYYYQYGGELVFASELKAFKGLPFTRGEQAINRSAITNFLYLGYVPGRQTIYRKVYKFPAGHYGIWQDGELKITPYWKPEAQVEETCFGQEKEAKNRLHHLLSQSVQRRLVSDVPVGTFLSGGVDSSVVTALAAKHHSGSIKTFSIGFKDGKYDESVYAQKVAEHLKTDHHAYQVTETDALEKIQQLLETYDQPFADSSAVPTMLVSELARKHVTVALSGDGGDELFMGYGMYNWAKRLQNPLLHLGRPMLAFLLQNHPSNRFKRAATLFSWKDKERMKSHIFSQEQYLFSQREIEAMAAEGWKRPLKVREKLRVKSRKLSAAEEQALFDLKNYLKDDLLVKVDMASMRSGLEVRVPMLDHRLVHFALNLDESLKVKGKVTKYLLKQVLYEHVPEKYFERPKWGFSVPLGTWLRTSLAHLVEEYLSPEAVAEVGIVSPEAVAQLLENFYKGGDYLYNRVWLLLLLHKWVLSHTELTLK